MKKIILLLLIYSSVSEAQLSDKGMAGKTLEAYVKFVLKDSIKIVQMRYETREVFCNPYAEFLINDTKYQSEYVEAFRFSNYGDWGLRLDPNPTGEDQLKDKLTQKSIHMCHAEILRYGAIESYVITHKVLVGIGVYPYSRKLNEAPIRGELAGLEMQVRKWISDSPEIKRELMQADSLTAINRNKIKALKKEDSLAVVNSANEEKRKGLMGMIDEKEAEKARNKRYERVGETKTRMDLIIHNYNAWYEKNNPGKITYYFEEPPVHHPSQMESEMEFQKKVAREQREEAEIAAAKKKAEDYYTNRGTTASPEMASAKDNAPVKKETFAAKLDRIKADGNKVGVIFTLRAVRTNPKPPPSSSGNTQMGSAMTEELFIEGEYMDESLQTLGKDFTAELNAALGRTDIELVDQNKIPYRNSRSLGMETRIDNWWATKYKVVFAYSIDPLINATKNGFSGKDNYEAKFNFISSVIVTEYIGDMNSKDKDMITQMSDMGGFSSSKLSQDKPFQEIKPLYKKLIEQLGTPLAEKIKTERATGVKKLVEKKLAD